MARSNTKSSPASFFEESALAPTGSVEQALDVVQAFFAAVHNEDLTQLTLLITPDCLWWSPTTGRSVASSALSTWQIRFRRLPYALADGPLIRRHDVHVYYDGELEHFLPEPAVRPTNVQPYDLAFNLSILNPRLGSERLFGDTLTLFMRYQQDRFRIYAMIEEFVLP